MTHPGREPTDPPPRRSRILGVTVPPPRKPVPTIPDSQVQDANNALWHLASRWSPAGIAAALLILFFALGGASGVRGLVAGLVEVTSASTQLQGEIKALRDDLAIEREERTKVMARLYATERNLGNLCDFVSAMNGGRPNKTWCSADGRSIKVEEHRDPPPHLGTETVWIYVE